MISEAYFGRRVARWLIRSSSIRRCSVPLSATTAIIAMLHVASEPAGTLRLAAELRVDFSVGVSPQADLSQSRCAARTIQGQPNGAPKYLVDECTAYLIMPSAYLA